MDLADAAGLAAVGRAQPHLSERDIVPRGQDFATVGHLYRSIEAGLAHLAERHGEDWLFVGPPRAQATTAHFGWPELIPVTDLASAQRAIDEILEQGEGPRGHWRDAHFGQFVAILDEYQQMLAAQPRLRPGAPGGRGQRPAARAGHRGAAHHRPADRAGGRPVQRRLRDPAPDPGAVLRPHRGDRRPAPDAGRRDHRADDPGAAAARRPDHHAARGPRLPRPDRRPQLRAVLRGRLPDAAPRGGLGAAGRAAGRGRRAVLPAPGRPRPGGRRAAGAGARRAAGDVPHAGRRAARGQRARPPGHRARPAGRRAARRAARPGP